MRQALRIHPASHHVHGSPPTVVSIEEQRRPPVTRSASVTLGVFAAALLAGAAIVLAIAAPSGLSGVERDLVRALSRLPSWLREVLVAVTQAIAAYAPLIVVAVLVVTRRFRRLVNLVGSLTVAGFVTGLALNRLFDDPEARAGLRELFEQRLQIPTGFPSPSYLAGLVALVIVESPWLERRWRRIFRIAVVLVVVIRLASGAVLPRELLLAVPVGLLVGHLGLLLFGAPDHIPHGRTVAATLGEQGFQLARLAQIAGRPDCWRATLVDGSRLHVRVMNPDTRIARLPARLYRSVRFQNTGSERPWASVVQTAEHEALAAAMARQHDVLTPRLRAVTVVGERSALLAFDELDGTPLAQHREVLSDEQLRGAWRAVAGLRRARVAHRRLRLEHLVEVDGEVWVTDFSRAEVGADAGLLSNDVAELLVITARSVGPERAVTVAVDELGSGAVSGALSRLQPLALTRATRRDAKEGDLLRQVIDEVVEQTEAGPVVPTDLERVSPRTLVLVGLSAVAFYLLGPQLAGASELWSNVRNANWWWFAVALLASAASIVGAAVAISGSVPEDVPFGANVLTQTAAAFVGFATPAQLGGMALNARFLERSGVDQPVALAAVGLNLVNGVVVHASLLAAFAFWRGSGGLGDLHLPSGTTALVVGAIAVVAAAVVVAVPAGRRLLVEKVGPYLKRAASGLAQVARRPIKLLQLVGGAVGVTGANMVALAACVAALDGSMGVASIGFVYLTASVVATAAPTPGGLGAVEATLIAGLTSAGLPSTTSVGAVLLYRLATFWLKIPPGFLAFHRLQLGSGRRSAPQ